MNKFTSYKELVDEQHRLKSELAVHKTALLNEWETTKQHLKPLENAVDFVSKITTKNKENPLLNLGIDFGVDVLIRRLLLGNAGVLTKMLVPMVMRNYSSNVLSVEGGKNLLAKARNFFKSFGKKKEAVPEGSVAADKQPDL